MNPGPVESAEHVASGIIEALKTQPYMLVMTITNTLLIGLLFYVAVAASGTREREIKWMYDQNERINNMLAQCTMPTPTGFRMQSAGEKPIELEAKP